MNRALLVPGRSLFAATLALTLFVLSPRIAAGQTPAGAAVPLTLAQERVRTADSTVTLSIGLRDGSTFIGRVIAVVGDSAQVRTNAGVLTFALNSITKSAVVREQDIVLGEYWFASPNTTRLLFGPTGRMQKKGTGYFSDHMVFLPGVSFGVADRVSVGGGMSLIPGVSPGDQLFYAIPKVGLVAGPKVNVAAGAMVLRISFDDDAETFGVGYLVGTYGGDNGSVTGGVGFGFVGGEMADSPALMLGGEKRVSNRMSLVTENYVFPGGFEGTLITGAVRILGEKISADIGFGRVFGDKGNDGTLPFVGLLVNF